MPRFFLEGVVSEAVFTKGQNGYYWGKEKYKYRNDDTLPQVSCGITLRVKMHTLWEVHERMTFDWDIRNNLTEQLK